jgi:hypothetical protein
VKRAFDWTWKTIDLLRHLREALSGTIKFWERFKCPNGDIGYFYDANSSDPVQHQIGLLLHAIEETFETMEGLQQKLDVLHESCRDSADAVSRYFQLVAMRFLYGRPLVLTSKAQTSPEHRSQRSSTV